LRRFKIEQSLARNFKISGVLMSSTKNGGIPMTDHIEPNSKFPICEHAQRMHDVLLVSSFALWAMLIGFAPVMTYRLLMA